MEYQMANSSQERPDSWPTHGEMADATGNTAPRPPAHGEIADSWPTQGKIADSRPPTQGEIPDSRPPTQGEIADSRPPTQGEIANSRPPAQGEIADPRPPTQSEIVDSRPPTQGEIADAGPTSSQGAWVMRDGGRNNMLQNTVDSVKLVNVKKRLARLFTARADGTFLVPQELLEQYKDLKKRDALIQDFMKSDLDPD